MAEAAEIGAPSCAPDLNQSSESRSAMSQPEQDKPKYGQYQQPEYGASMANTGRNYNP